MNISDPTKITQIDSLEISSFPKRIFTKGKSKTRKKKTQAKYMTKVRYITDFLRMNDHNYCKDSNSEMLDVQQNSIRSRALSESSTNLDGWIVFENKLYEACNKSRTLYPTETPIFNSPMKKNDSPCKDSNSDAKIASIRLRSLSESSTNSEDSNYSSIALDEQEITECSRMPYDCLTKINDEHHKDYNKQMQKRLFQHHQLSSDNSEYFDDFTSSENSDDSNNSENSDTNSSFAIEESDDVDDYVESFHDGDNQLDDSIIFADEDSEELIAQTKKVSFDPTPVIHVMVAWNYAYRAARKGPWEEIARDNERFKGRIKSIAVVLDPILNSKHRSQVWQERFAFSE